MPIHLASNEESLKDIHEKLSKIKRRKSPLDIPTKDHLMLPGL
jgi:hypothetical protein